MNPTAVIILVGDRGRIDFQSENSYMEAKNDSLLKKLNSSFFYKECDI